MIKNSSVTEADKNDKGSPGPIIAIGGAEDREGEMVVLRRVLQEGRKVASNAQDPNIIVITAASSVPHEYHEIYYSAFAKLGAERNLVFVDIPNRREAYDEDQTKRVQNADIVFFTGGCQANLRDKLLDTPIMQAVRHVHENGKLLAGTSAGAVFLSDRGAMLMGGDPKDATIKGGIPITKGSGMTPGVTFDTHFPERERGPRAAYLASARPDLLTVGLGENSGVLYRNGCLEAIGEGNVWAYDGRHILTNFNEVAQDQEFKIYRMRPPIVLAKGDIFEVNLRKKEVATHIPKDESIPKLS